MASSGAILQIETEEFLYLIVPLVAKPRWQYVLCVWFLTWELTLKADSVSEVWAMIENLRCVNWNMAD